MKKLLLIPIIAMLTACSSTHLTPDKAIVVQPLAQATPTPERPIKVTLMRDYGALSGGVAQYHILDNGKKIASLYSKEMTTYYAEPGNHAISVGFGKNGEDGRINFSEFKLGEEPEIHVGFNEVMYIKRMK